MTSLSIEYSLKVSQAQLNVNMLKKVFLSWNTKKMLFLLLELTYIYISVCIFYESNPYWIQTFWYCKAILAQAMTNALNINFQMLWKEYILSSFSVPSIFRTKNPYEKFHPLKLFRSSAPCFYNQILQST